MKEVWTAFKKFITRGNVVDMAVGVAVASAFTAIVTAFTKGVISPLLALMTKSADLASMKWILRPASDPIYNDAQEIVGYNIEEVAIIWGSVVQAVIDFLLVAFVLFCIMRFATAVMKRANKLAQGVHKTLLMSDEQIKAKEEAEAKAKAEEEAKAKAEAEAAEAAAAAARAKEEAEEQRKVDTVALLREIRDLLNKKEG